MHLLLALIGADKEGEERRRPQRNKREKKKKKDMMMKQQQSHCRTAVWSCMGADFGEPVFVPFHMLFLRWCSCSGLTTRGSPIDIGISFPAGIHNFLLRHRRVASSIKAHVTILDPSYRGWPRDDRSVDLAA